MRNEKNIDSYSAQRSTQKKTGLFSVQSVACCAVTMHRVRRRWRWRASKGRPTSVNSEIFFWRGRWGGKSTTAYRRMPSCVETWASNGCRSHARPRRPNKLPWQLSPDRYPVAAADQNSILDCVYVSTVLLVGILCFLSAKWRLLLLTEDCEILCGGWRFSVNKAFQNAPKCTILKAKVQKFSGRRHSPLPRPHPWWEDDTPPHAHPLVASGPPSSTNLAPPLRIYVIDQMRQTLQWPQMLLPFRVRMHLGWGEIIYHKCGKFFLA